VSGRTVKKGAGLLERNPLQLAEALQISLSRLRERVRVRADAVNGRGRMGSGRR